MLRIATRRSALARAQAFQVGQAIAAAGGPPFELVPMATTGDRHPDRAVDELGTKGVFCDTVRQAVLDSDCDLVVHSYKDLPSARAPGLTVAAVPPRANPRDVLVSREPHALATLPDLATVGTSSARRRLQLLRARPSLQVLALRGNIDTRLRKVADGELDATVLAFAGLQRLYAPTGSGGLGPGAVGPGRLHMVPLEPGECLPAPAQGALAVECREDDAATLAVCATVDDGDSRTQVTAERSFLARLGGGCLAPVGALCLPAGGQLELLGLLADPVHRRVLRMSLRGSADRPDQLGRELADRVAASGGAQMLAAVRG